MSGEFRKRLEDIPASHRNKHEKYEYFRHSVVSCGDESGKCEVAVYRLLPGKSNYPYHYHAANEEVFYIISGSGVLRTPEGEKAVSAGDFLFFPANKSGAHKLTNNSGSETLVYIDFSVVGEVDVSFYPDSDKLGIWGKDINRLYNADNQPGYYDNE